MTPQAPSPQSKNGKAVQKSAESRSPQVENQPATGNLNNSSSKQNATRHQPLGWSLSVKATVIALTASVLPVLVVGTANYLSVQSLQQQITSAKQTDTQALAATELALQRQRRSLLVDTAACAILAGAIAAFFANRAVRPVLSAATTSNTLVNKLQRNHTKTSTPAAKKDELAALETNMQLIAEQLPLVTAKRETEVERFQVLMNISHRIWESLSEEDVLRTTVKEVRQAFRTDRALIFRFNSDWSGAFVEESVASSWSKMLWATIQAPDFELEFIEQYRSGGVRAIHNINQANLTDAQIGFLEQFAVKSLLAAPIIRDNQLYGLLVVHQCAEPRSWQQLEIDLFTQLAAQVGFALNYARFIEKVDTKVAQAQVFIDLTRRIRESLQAEDILKTTVTEVRKALSTDRVLVYEFDAQWYGSVIAESVVPGFPKALWAQIKDPCFAEGYIDKYQAGRVQAIDNIHTAGLTDCYLGQLEPFAVKANLVAPILKDGYLFGLLIAHECAAPRQWQQAEIDLFAQVATQVGFALDQARLLQRIDTEGMRTQLLAHLTRRIRESLQAEDILKTTVTEVRKALSTDRVLVYEFDAQWYGSVIAESVVPGFPKALWAQIKDPCFAEGYIDKYQAGRVQAIDNIHTAGLTDCYLGQLEPFAVKANLVAPILKDGYLFGLLIAHECAAPRQWQQAEIDLFAQVATQVGFALDHARLLLQVEQAYQAAEAATQQQRQQKEALQHQVSELLQTSEATVKLLSTEAVNQMEAITTAYDRIRIVGDSAQQSVTNVEQTKLQLQQATETIQAGQETMSQTGDNIVAVQQATLVVADKIKGLDQPIQKLSQVADLIVHVVSQLKLYGMNIKLAASRSNSEANQEFTTIAEKLLTSVKQLDMGIADIKPLTTKIQAEISAAAVAMETGTEQAIAGTQLVAAAQQKLDQIATVSAQMNLLIAEINQTVANCQQTSTAASEAVLEVANLTSHTSEQSIAMAKSFNQLAVVTQDLL